MVPELAKTARPAYLHHLVGDLFSLQSLQLDFCSQLAGIRSPIRLWRTCFISGHFREYGVHLAS